MEQPIPVWPGRMAGPLHVRETPSGPPDQAVFVHGLAGSATNWTDLMGELRDIVTGHAVDLPGNGHSPAPSGGDYSITGHARAVIGLLEETGPAHLFGNSLGGAVVVRAAAMRPDLVRSLTLISPALPDLMPRYGPARVFLATTPRLGELAATVLGRLPAEQRVAASMAMIYADPGLLHPERLREAVAELRRRDGLPYSGQAMIGSARGIVAEYFRGSLWRDAATITAPTLLIYGRRDRLVRPIMARKAGRTFRDARLVLLPNCGHCAQMELPQVVAAEARRLILETRLGNAPLAS
ncbi:alpha/beta fold hydrolase [Nonomuraea soli]|uniref:Pimeloyl-ACP methyl ester carboxylesterase n=1 Tax=Nonomuraea soli TaxID=1032476 RepID=A0A7W0CRD8_9ACTN|nr:alpha/beta fold hydrolase [Nonomuraea soli]MBA2895860.1 pimeloyl-ACP methyl ester carboxylesterase [Nonomuraea soli]